MISDTAIDQIETPLTDIEIASIAKKNALKEKFEVDLVKLVSKESNIKHFFMTSNDPIEKRAINRIQILYVIDILSNNKHNEKNFYNLRKTYVIKNINGENYLYDKLDSEKHLNGGRIVPLEDMFDTLTKIHQDVGFQGRDPMLKEALKFYGNVTRPIVELFLDFSEEYQIKKKKVKNHGLVVKPIRSSDFNSRWQIDLIDFRTLPDGDYNWILTVQDHCTKFIWLVPLKQKCGQEVAKALYELFGVFGAPYILQSDNGKEFRNQVVYGLKILWPGLNIIHGRPRRPQSQGSVERANGDVQNILGSWMRTNKSTFWATALPIVTNMKNRKHHAGINMSPYKALFGQELFVGLEVLNLPVEQKNKITTAKQLYSILGNFLIDIFYTHTQFFLN